MDVNDLNRMMYSIFTIPAGRCILSHKRVLFTPTGLNITIKMSTQDFFFKSECIKSTYCHDMTEMYCIDIFKKEV